jgi:hypothetical protein
LDIDVGTHASATAPNSSASRRQARARNRLRALESSARESAQSRPAVWREGRLNP